MTQFPMYLASVLPHARGSSPRRNRPLIARSHLNFEVQPGYLILIEWSYFLDGVMTLERIRFMISM